MKKKYIIYFLTWCLLFFANNLDAQILNQMKQSFQNPPASAQPKTYWWWLNGNVDTVRIKEEMLAMKEAGLSGFDIFEIGVPAHDTVVKPGPAFLGDESLQSIRVALEMAEKLEMSAGLNLASSWNAGGSWTTPEHSAKSIYFSVTPDGSGKNLRLNFPEIGQTDDRGRKKLIKFASNGRPEYYEEIVVLALPVGVAVPLDTAEIINVSSYFNPDTEMLEWPHEGRYQIYRYICSNSGEALKLPSERSTGPIIDHFDAPSTEAHFSYIINRLKTVLGDDISQSALKSFYLASYEATGFTWTPTLPEVFEKLNGYQINKLIPALFDEELFTREIADNFKIDFRRTLSELMIDNFYRTAKRISNQHGLKINSESGGPGFPLHNVPAEPLKSLGVMDLPRGEFWINHNRLNADGIDILRMVKEVSAASHIYGRGVVEEEAFTSFQHWQEGPFEMKPSGDRAFCEGMNKVVVHGFSHNPTGTGYPGIVYAAGTHFNDKRVWWKKIKPFTEYLSRISYILQESEFMADVLYYYGDAIPNYTGHKNGRFSVAPGYDYEVINTEILKQLTTKDGQVMLPNGQGFKLLVLEPEDEIHPEVFLKIKELAAEGAVIVSDKPKQVAHRGNLPDLKFSQQDIDQLWTTWNTDLHETNKGMTRILSGATPIQVLESLQIAVDFGYEDADLSVLDYTHYQKDQIDFYLIRNTTQDWISRECLFRQQDKIPEIWNPVNGQIAPVWIYREEDHHTILPVTLPPYGTLFVVFQAGHSAPPYTNISFSGLFPPLLEYRSDGLYFLEEGHFTLQKNDQKIPVINYQKQERLGGAWEVFFPEGWDAPGRVIFPELISWSESDIEGIKYFSGTATYKKTFQDDISSMPSKNQKIYLDLGDLTNVAEVWLNDQPLGISWSKPYRLDITSVLKPGDNNLTVEVANTWSNRLKGDALTGKKFTHTNITQTNINGLNKIRVPWAEVPLIKAGLFGPVTITTVTPVLQNKN